MPAALCPVAWPAVRRRTLRLRAISSLEVAALATLAIAAWAVARSPLCSTAPLRGPARAGCPPAGSQQQQQQAASAGVVSAADRKRHLFVDGMNAVGALYGRKAQAEQGRQVWQASMYSGYPLRLVGALQALQRLRPELKQVTAVFDQPRSRGRGSILRVKAWARAAKRTWSCQGVTVRIAHGGMAGEADRADRVLADLVASGAAEASPIVVSDDRALCADLTRLGAECRRCDWLRKELGRDANLVRESEQNARVPQRLRECFSTY
mmetsp:Transcript_10237/g.20553  ORF Transcript_10237/g.20553 Transcript_10237/m.20553 type:complete len:266 (+) Transcript_10237:80-877(+)